MKASTIQHLPINTAFSSLIASPDEKRLATIEKSPYKPSRPWRHRVSIHEISSSKIITLSSEMHSIVFDTSSCLYGIDCNSHLIKIDLHNNQPIHTLPYPKKINCFCVNAQSNQVFFTNSSPRDIFNLCLASSDLSQYHIIQSLPFFSHKIISSPNNRYLAFLHQNASSLKNALYNQITIMDLNTHKFILSIPSIVSATDILWSDDSQNLYVIGSCDKTAPSFCYSHLFQVSLQGDIQQLTTKPHLSEVSSNLQWYGNTLYFHGILEGKGGYGTYTIGATKTSWTSLPSTIHRWTILAKSSQIWCVHSSFDTPPKLSSIPIDSPFLLKNQSSPYKIHILSQKTQGIPYYLLKPKNTSCFSLIIDIHGGPNTCFANSYDPIHQTFLQNNFAVLAINFPGSSSYGVDFLKSIYGKWNEIDIEAFSWVFSKVKKQLGAKLQKVGIHGYSYGGFLGAALLPLYPEIKAAVLGAGIYDFEPWLLQSTNRYFVQKVHLQAMKKIPQKQLKKSPILQANKIHTPTLLIHGTKDSIVPIEQSQKFYLALQKSGCITQLIEQKNAGHGLRMHFNPFLRNEYLKQTIHWFNQFL